MLLSNELNIIFGIFSDHRVIGVTSCILNLFGIPPTSTPIFGLKFHFFLIAEIGFFVVFVVAVNNFGQNIVLGCVASLAIFASGANGQTSNEKTSIDTPRVYTPCIVRPDFVRADFVRAKFDQDKMVKPQIEKQNPYHANFIKPEFIRPEFMRSEVALPRFEGCPTHKRIPLGFKLQYVSEELATNAVGKVQAPAPATKADPYASFKHTPAPVADDCCGASVKAPAVSQVKVAANEPIR